MMETSLHLSINVTMTIDNLHMTGCRLRDKFCDTGVDFQKYLNLRVVNFSTLKLDEIKLLIFWLLFNSKAFKKCSYFRLVFK